MATAEVLERPVDKLVAGMRKSLGPVEIGFHDKEGVWRSVYTAYPKQNQFHQSPATYRLFGGAAGPGKSVALLMEAISQSHVTENPDDGPKINTLILRRTFPELQKSILERFQQFVPQEFYRSYHAQQREVIWHNGAKTRFGYCRREADVWQYQGSENLFIGIDELTQFTLKMWEGLTAWNRCPIESLIPNMAGATNPIGPGHSWVKAFWVDKKPAPGMEEPEKYDPSEYEYIPALIEDNPVYANDAVYQGKLEKLSRHLREALRRGDWNILAGTYFDILDRNRHCFRPEEVRELRYNWTPRWISIDWGFDHNAAVLWHAQVDPETTLTYREFLKNKLSSRVLAYEIAERSKYTDENGSQQQEPIQAIYLSPDAFAKRDNRDTIAQEMGKVLRENKLPSPTQADDDRVGGWMLMYELLQEEPSSHWPAGWMVGSNCTNLLETLGAMPRDDKNVEDCAKFDGDDSVESARYGIKSRARPGKKPLEQKIRERVQQKALEGKPTQVAILARKMEVEHKNQNRPVRVSSRYHPNWRRRVGR